MAFVEFETRHCKSCGEPTEHGIDRKYNAMCLTCRTTSSIGVAARAVERRKAIDAALRRKREAIASVVTDAEPESSTETPATTDVQIPPAAEAIAPAPLLAATVRRRERLARLASRGDAGA